MKLIPVEHDPFAGPKLVPVEHDPFATYTPNNLSVMQNSAYKTISGLVDSVLNAPTNLVNLGIAGVGTALTAAGRPDLAPNVLQTPDFARRGLEALGLENPNWNPQTSTQKVIDRATQFSVAGALSPGNMVRNALMGAGTGAASQITENVTGSPLAGLAVSMAPLVAGPLASKISESLPDSMQFNKLKRNVEAADIASGRSVKRQTLQDAADIGYASPPADVNPTFKNRLLQGAAGGTATRQAIAQQNQELTNDIARREIGLKPGTPLTPEAFDQARAPANAVYRKVADTGPLQIDAEFNNIPVDGMPEIKTPPVGQQLSGNNKPYIDSQEAITAVRQLRRDGFKALGGPYNPDMQKLGQAKLAAADQLDSLIERNLATKGNPQLFQDYMNARQHLAKVATIENSLIEGPGDINARRWAQALAKGVPLSGNVETAAKFTQTNPFASKYQPTAPADISPVSLGTSVLAGASAPTRIQALLGVGLPFLRKPIRNFILSPYYQQRLLSVPPPTTPLSGSMYIPQVINQYGH